MYSNPHKALYGVAPPRRTKRTVFGGAPCTELCAYRYTYTKAANLYVNPQTRTVAAFCYTSRKNAAKSL